MSHNLYSRPRRRDHLGAQAAYDRGRGAERALTTLAGVMIALAAAAGAAILLHQSLVSSATHLFGR